MRPCTTVKPFDDDDVPSVVALASLVTDSILMTPPMSMSVIRLSAVDWPAVLFSTVVAIVCALPNVKPAAPSAPFIVAVDSASTGSACAFRVAPCASNVSSGWPAPVRDSARMG